MTKLTPIDGISRYSKSAFLSNNGVISRRKKLNNTTENSVFLE